MGWLQALNAVTRCKDGRHQWGRWKVTGHKKSRKCGRCGATEEHVFLARAKAAGRKRKAARKR